MALGDGLNDLSMIEFAGMGVAVDNANPTLKEAANFISKSMMKMVSLMLLKNLFLVKMCRQKEVLMKVTLICVGKVKEKFYRDAIKEI